MSDGTLIRVGGSSFHGTVDRHAPFEGFALVEFEGWGDAPAARGESVERPDGHGDFDTPVTRGARLITMSGWCRARELAMLGHRRNELMSLLADGVQGRVEVTEYGETTWANVRLYGTPTFKRRGSTGYADWSLKLRAVDPRRYGAVHEYPAGVAAVQYGNFPARPQLIVSGSSSGGYTVTGPNGRRIVVTRPITSGSPHTIDFATGGLFIGGVRQSRSISVYQPWTIGPGLPLVTASVDSGLSLIQRVTDTYV